jgi:hypothetical protein
MWVTSAAVGVLANLTTKIITVWVIKWLLMHLEIFRSKCVSSMKKCIFISLVKCFCTVFLRLFRGYLWLLMRVRLSISIYAGIVYEHYCLCPGWPCGRKSFKKVVYVHDVIPLCTWPPTIRPIVPPRFEHLKISPLYRRLPPCEFILNYTYNVSDINNTNASPPFREAFVEYG